MITALYAVIVLLAVLKLSGAIVISWWMVFSPFILILALAILNAFLFYKAEKEFQKKVKSMEVRYEAILKDLKEKE